MKFASLVLIVITISACGGGVKKLQYLQGPLDPSSYSSLTFKEPVIQAGDVISITVYSDNPAASALYNQASGSGSIGSGANPGLSGGAAGYLVGNDGTIRFHSLGNIKVAGLTRPEVATLISDKLTTVLNNPYCQVRFNNFRVTVLGEVRLPNVFSIPSEKISVLEVLGLAGDLTTYGRRDSVMVIRETATERKLGWLDLRKTDVFNSEFYYLHQNDVVVVQPSRKKTTDSDEVLLRNISIAASVISTIAIVINVLR